MKILIIILLMIPALCQADRLILGGFSKHHGSPVPLNESHPGIGIEKNDFEYAIYKNSIDKTSFAFAVIKRPFSFFGFDFGYRIGFGTNYEEDKRRGYDGRMYSLENTFNGIQPQAQIVVTKNFNYAAIDLGISRVSSIILKINL